MLENRSQRKTLVTAAIVAAVIVVVIVLWKFVLSKEQVVEAIEYIRSFGAWTVVVYLAVYISLVALSFPATLLNITSGILFGLWTAMAVSVVGAITGASLTFLFARYIVRDQVKHYIDSFESSEKIFDMADEKGWKFVVVLRINPFIPAVLKNYGFGLTNIPFAQYFFASLAGQAPLTLFYTYLGWIGGHAMLDSDSQPETYHWIILAGGVVISLGALYWAYSSMKSQ